MPDVKWDRVPQRIKHYLDKGERLPSNLRKELVRIIIDDIHVPNKPYPRTQQLRLIASKVVAKYPKSLKDTIGSGTEAQGKVGSGFDSLLNQLVWRVDNLSRPNQSSLKRSVEQGKPHPKKICVDSYGCVRWQSELPPGETEETQKDKKKKLMDMFNRDESQNEDGVSRDMLLLYATIRKDINTGSNLGSVIEEWPYLFKVPYMLEHFEHLMDFDIVKRMETNIGGRVPKLIKYFQANNRKVEQTLKDVKDAVDKKEDETPYIMGILLLLSDYFGEKDVIVAPVGKVSIGLDT